MRPRKWRCSKSMTVRGFQAWAKTDALGRAAHHLAHHSFDVAAVLEALSAQPVIEQRLSRAAGRRLNERERAWLAAFAFFHDIGKLSPAFQTHAWPSEMKCASRSHLTEGWRWLDMAMRNGAMEGAAEVLFEPLERAARTAPGTAEQWIGALFGHHGRPTQPQLSSDFRILPHYDWRSEETAIGRALRAWFADAGVEDASVLARPLLVHLFAGLLALSDWIGSDSSAFPHRLDFDLGYAEGARRRASDALIRVGLVDAPWPNAAPSFAVLTNHPAPRGLQAAVGDLPLDVPLAIVEAETGSGKTEAALWHFARLRSAGRVDAMYFAVPTRAAANQLFERVRGAMMRIGGPAPVLAVPGQLRAGDAKGIMLPGFEVLWDDGGRYWAAEHATRFLAAAVAVGTIDQALMAALKVRHAHLRGAALSRSLLVIDEVHASDAYMNVVARGLVRDHLALGGQALLMSATLGAGARCAWLGMPLEKRGAAEAISYPALWRSDDPSPISIAAAFAQDKMVAPVLVPTMDATAAAERAVAAARDGARVLVVRNTVNDAVAAWRVLVEADAALSLQVADGPALHHSRFAAEDRAVLDRAVEAAFGKGTSARGLIAVGTQTLEQSLDIDADLLITDLCPMDVLLQRIGRLHRHQRSRPAGFERACVHVLSPPDGLDPLARTMVGEHGLGGWEKAGVLTGIYIDLRSLEATRRLVASEATWSIPADNRRLVEAATHPEALEAIEREMGWADYTAKVVMKGLAERQHGQLLSLDRSKPYPETFPEADEKVRTRLGDIGPILRLPEGTIGPFGAPITQITPPARWCAGLSGDEAVEVDAGEEGLRLQVADRVFHYDRAGLRAGTEAAFPAPQN